MYVHLGKTKRPSFFSKNNEINEKLQKNLNTFYFYSFFFLLFLWYFKITIQ
jgi:hypothetical protein